MISANISRVIYVTDAGASLMDKIRDEVNCWSEGDENLCLTGEDAMTITELAEVIGGMSCNCDVIVSK